MNEKLRECPFCGVEPSGVDKREYDYGYRTNYTIECSNCGLSMFDLTEKALIANWDTRSINTPKHETVNFTLEDIISVKTALTKIGVSVPETNDLSNIQVINLFRLLALQVRKGIYE